MKKQILILGIFFFVYINITIAQMIVKDNDSNILMKVNDEGTVGSMKVDSINVRSVLADSLKAGPIRLPLGLVPAIITNKLYNNSGALYWNGSELATTSSSAGGWTDEGGVVRLTTGTDNVGIGTTSPAEALDVLGTVQMSGFKLTTNPTDGYVLTTDVDGSGSWQPAPGLTLPYNGVTSYSSTAFRVTNSGTGGGADFVIDNPSNTNDALHGSSGGSGSGIYGNNNGTGRAGFFEIENTDNTSAALSASTDGGGEAVLATTTGTGSACSFSINNVSNTQSVLTLSTTGAGPALQANGTIEMNGFEMSNGAGNGYVLTSDAIGIGTWQPSSYGIGGSGTASYIAKFTGVTILGNSILYETDSKIGIGTTNPGEALTLGDSRNLQIGYADGAGGSLFFRRINSQTNPVPPANGAGIYYNWDSDNNEQLVFNTAGNENIVVNSNGDVGIGTDSPSEKLDVNGTAKITDAHVTGDLGVGTASPMANLDVNGTVRVGVNGVTFSEIIEMTGTLTSSNHTNISYPTGYNMDNIRVLSLELYTEADESKWVGLGFKNVPAVYMDPSVSYELNVNVIAIWHEVNFFEDKPFRMLLMKTN